METHSVITIVHRKLIELKKTVAVAESCTGGLASSYLISQPGSSAYFILGIVAYSNEAKTRLLKIPPRLIQTHGAVSPEAAQQLSNSVRTLAKTDFGIGITGIAGPGGGSKEKPRGTVFISVSGKKRTACRKFIFSGTRTSVRKQAARASLSLLNTLLKN